MARASRKRGPTSRGGLEPAAGRPPRVPDEARLLRAVEELRRDLRRVTDGERAVHIGTRKAATLLQADTHCCAVVTPGVVEADLMSWTGPRDSWDRILLGAFARGESSDVPPRIALARLRRRGRPWGVIAVSWDHAAVGWDVRGAFTRVRRGLKAILSDIDRDRIAEVRSRIDRKIMDQLRSRDLFYQILDGLRSLARYDHSATLLIGESDESTLEIVAEKLAWRRGKSRRIGERVQLERGGFTQLLEAGVTGLRREGSALRSWSGESVAPWVEKLVTDRSTASPREPRVSEVILAPIKGRDGLRALLAVSSVHAGTVGAHEAELITSFLPQVSIALRNSRRAEALEAKMLETERKHAMADLARGVAHDVNNALGSVVPLLQQIREEVDRGTVDHETLRDDLEQIDRSVRVCRDIFGGMLRFARTAARPAGRGSVRAAIDMALLILTDNLRRRRVAVRTEVPDGLPRVTTNQAELEQLLLNLVSNARDAMRAGGQLTITARSESDDVVIEVGDTGCGIDPAQLPRVQDPFFTTKRDGNGLGLSICRSIVWRSGGALWIDSEPERGTRVTIRLPVADAADTKGGSNE